MICYQVLIGLNDLPKSGGGWRLPPCPPVPTDLLKDDLTTFLGDHKVMHTSLPIHRSANIWDHFSFSRFVRSYRSLSQIIMQDASITSNCIIYSYKKREKYLTLFCADKLKQVMHETWIYVKFKFYFLENMKQINPKNSWNAEFRKTELFLG